MKLCFRDNAKEETNFVSLDLVKTSQDWSKFITLVGL